MLHKRYPIVIKEKRPDGGRILINTSGVDRDQDRVMPQGARLENYKRNPVVQWGHNYREPWATIGNSRELVRTDEGIEADFDLRPAANDSDPQNVVLLLWNGNWIHAASIGFDPRSKDGEPARVENQYGGNDYTDWDLLEWSLVPIPSNQDALRLAVKGLGDADLVTLRCDNCGNPYQAPETFAFVLELEALPDYCPRCDHLYYEQNRLISKTVIPYGSHGDTPKADEGRAWDGPGARRRLQAWAGGEDWLPAKYRKGFCFVRGDVDLLGSYVGPHHDIIDGSLSVVWNGARAAMGSLVFGARGGRIDDEGDRRGVYNHLAQHYRQFGKDVPEFRDYAPDELRDLFGEPSAWIRTLDVVTNTGDQRVFACYHTYSVQIAEDAIKWDFDGENLVPTPHPDAGKTIHRKTATFVPPIEYETEKWETWLDCTYSITGKGADTDLDLIGGYDDWEIIALGDVIAALPAQVDRGAKSLPEVCRLTRQAIRTAQRMIQKRVTGIGTAADVEELDAPQKANDPIPLNDALATLAGVMENWTQNIQEQNDE